MRFHGRATLNEILADICLKYIKTTEDKFADTCPHLSNCCRTYIHRKR